MATSWDQPKSARYLPLKKDAVADVVIIGGGLTGILSAYLLTKAGKSVVLLEKGRIGFGATGATTAFVTQMLDTSLADLEKLYGAQDARRVWRAGGDAIAELERIVTSENIACEFIRCDANIYARDADDYASLRHEAAAASRLGCVVSLKKDGALHFPNAGYLEIPGQAKFHPLQFLHGVAALAQQAGARIHENTEVTELFEKGPVVVATKDGFTVRADDVIVATYLPFNNPKPTHFKKGSYQSYVLEAHVRDCPVADGIYWNLNLPYDYFRVDRSRGRVRIIVGGADHRSELPVRVERCYETVEHVLKGILGHASYTIARKWSGTIIESSDGLPLIGAYASHRYVATAFSGNGMTYATIAAMLFRDQIAGVHNPWGDLFDPKRTLKPNRLLHKGLDYAREFFGGALKNWLAW